jgi:UDP-perosamine 4-acetyltransferase
LIIGAGGHAKVLIDAMRTRSIEPSGITDVDPEKTGTTILGVPIIGNDDIIKKYSSVSTHLVNGLGSVRTDNARRRIFARFSDDGYRFEAVIHFSAIIAADVLWLEGIQIMAGVVIQTGCRFGKNVLVNTRASIDHDCQIGDHVHIAPGVILSGGVSVKDDSHIGTGATIIQNISIGRRSMVAAGAVVTKDVADGVMVAGIPAREMRP